MDKSRKGFFPAEEEMPCLPTQISVGYYFLPNTLDRMEQEEAAARIVSFSCQLNQWVGVSWPDIIGQMEEDYKKDEELRKKLDLRNEKMEAWFLQLRRHFWLCFFTLGFYGLFFQKPQRPGLAVEEDQLVPFTGIYLFGPRHVVTGIQELLEKKMLKKVTQNDGDNKLDVFFPTPALISRIMEVQGVSAG